MICFHGLRHGRKHDVMPSKVNYRANIWALKILGCTHVIASTATGSLQEDIEPGDLVLLDSFIDRYCFLVLKMNLHPSSFQFLNDFTF